MTLLYISMVIFGIFGIGFGFWGQGSLKPPLDTLAAISLPVSLILGLLGTLLLCVPRFFG